ncbi:hypothetical protein Dimus_034861 [Dionaea muscipula]
MGKERTRREAAASRAFRPLGQSATPSIQPQGGAGGRFGCQADWPPRPQFGAEERSRRRFTPSRSEPSSSADSTKPFIAQICATPPRRSPSWISPASPISHHLHRSGAVSTKPLRSALHHRDAAHRGSAQHHRSATISTDPALSPPTRSRAAAKASLPDLLIHQPPPGGSTTSSRATPVHRHPAASLCAIFHPHAHRRSTPTNRPQRPGQSLKREEQQLQGWGRWFQGKKRGIFQSGR